MDASEPERLPAWKVRAHENDLRRVSLARGAVNDGLAVGSESGVEDRLLRERKRLERPSRLCDLSPGAPSDEVRNPCDRRYEERDRRRREENAIPASSWNRRKLRGGARESRQRLEVEREVARG